MKVNKAISNKPCYFKPSAKIIGQIYSIGLPAIISQALISVMTYGLNIILGGGMESLVVSVCRQLLFVFPFAEMLTAIVAFVLFKQIYSKKVTAFKE